MADKQISDLTSASALTDGSLFVLEQAGAAMKANWGMMKNYISPGVAAQYSSSSTYAVGDYVIHNDTLYRCITAITTAESWTAAHWESVTMGGELSRFNYNEQFNSFDALAEGNGTSGSLAGITFTKNSDGSWTISGTATGTATRNIAYYANRLPDGIYAGRKYYLKRNGGTAPIQFYFYGVGGSSDLVGYYLMSSDGEIQVPENAVSGMVRFRIASGTSINETATYQLIALSPYVYDGSIHSTGDTTDMGPVIQSTLENTGVCTLSEGTFYVSPINMPAHSTIRGCGEKTKIRLLDSVTTGAALTMSEYCTIEDLSLWGSDTDIDVDTLGGRTGVAFIADYDGTDTGTAYQTHHCMMSNVWIYNFSRQGILCHNTSINYAKGLYATNVYIYGCHIGLNIDYYSEFNKFTNCCFAWCWYACVNNSGNNVFTACTFHATQKGFYIDGTKPNAGHGTLNGCTFCHIGSNTGTAVHLVSVSQGFIISNCQFWYNLINIVSCSGIVFSGCEFGRGTTGQGMDIMVTSGNLCLFVGCVFHNDVTYPPVFTISATAKARFASCYGGVSGELITA